MSSGVITALVASGAVFSLMKLVFAGLAILVGDDGDELLRRRLADFQGRLDQFTLSEALWWLMSTGLRRLTAAVSNPMAAAYLLLSACVFLNATAIVLATSFLLRDDPEYVNSAHFLPLFRDVLFEFFHTGSFVAHAAVLSGALVTSLTVPLTWKLLASVRQERILRDLIVRLCAALAFALASGWVPFLVLRWALVSQAQDGSSSQFEFHLAYVLATSADPRVLVFPMIASAAAASVPALTAIATAVVLYLYASPSFLRDASLRLVQAMSKDKAGIINQLGTFAGTIAGLSSAVVALLKL